MFPGTEGERSYTYGRLRLRAIRWAYRSHPVRVGIAHHYRLLIQVGRAPDFPAALRHAPGGRPMPCRSRRLSARTWRKSTGTASAC